MLVFLHIHINSYYQIYSFLKLSLTEAFREFEIDAKDGDIKLKTVSYQFNQP